MMVIASIFIGFVCFVGGIFVGSMMFEKMGRLELFKRIEESGRRIPEVISELRNEDIQKVNIPEAEIIAPMIDSVGVPYEGEDLKCMVRIVELSKQTLGILSQNFLKKGLVVKISCNYRKINFARREAEVTSISVRRNALRINLKFIEPLEGF